MLDAKQIDAFFYDPELKRVHGETLKKAWFLQMMKKAKEKWNEHKKLGITLHTARVSK